MKQTEHRIQQLLDKRIADKSIRTLAQKDHLIDFCSNDYLGLSRSALLKSKVEEEIKMHSFHKWGATGSRLISGNSAYIEALENKISQFHNAESALIFNSGYDANSGFFSSVPQKGDLIIYDELVHASIRDGIKMSRAESVSFRHNDINDLDSKLKMRGLNKFISIESVYSMDGDFAPMEAVVSLCKKQIANLVVDEAHATGLYGRRGEGLVQMLGLEDDVFARTHTFGKALGCHGAVVLGSEVLKQFLINYSRQFIFTTAMPFHSLASIKCSYDILTKQNNKRKKINRLIDLFKQKIKVTDLFPLIVSESPIQCLIIPGNEQAKHISTELEKRGYYAKAILYPTVPKGSERIRICIHSFNTEAEVSGLAEALNELVVYSISA